MMLRNIIAIPLGFLTIALLGSLFAGLQVFFYSHADELLGQASLNKSEIIQLTVKLVYVSFSCLIGGMLTTLISKNRRATLIVGVLITIVIGWLWLQTVYPVWFWGLLSSGVIPCTMLGYHFARETQVSFR